MSNSISDFFYNINFFDLQNSLFNTSFYEFLFPFLLAYALFFTILQKVKVFQNKQGKPIKPIIIVISFISSFYGISFETSPGETIGSLLMVMIPNISALTMGILTLYIVGSLLGKDFFRGLFEKDQSAYLFFGVGAIGLGAVVFYVGIAMGFWNYDPLSQESYWNVILAVSIFILAIVFLIIGLILPALVLGFVFFTFVFNSGQGSILELFIDPIIFIFFIFALFFSWVSSSNSKDTKKQKLSNDLKNAEISLNKFIEKNGNKRPEDYDSRIFDIIDKNFENKKKKWEKIYPNESWK